MGHDSFVLSLKLSNFSDILHPRRVPLTLLFEQLILKLKDITALHLAHLLDLPLLILANLRQYGILLLEVYGSCFNLFSRVGHGFGIYLLAAHGRLRKVGYTPRLIHL